MPRPWNRDKLTTAYRLSASEFERLVNGATRVKAMTKPAAEDFPLSQHATGTGVIEGLTARLYDEAPILGQREQERRSGQERRKQA